ncbi:MAG: bifunctional hydroxymethylpyrimidine kinase/phosphomethylpyrimidine kinase [Armatimonadota bacterium]|nr:bifunctional hydroxymethylpyrimidine kinase/phosphomethylpyrimidine kinase [Armatimonadota bacterium]MDR5697453.1 bifunctional hydroxymethylpyrimidine kinase/phosphomethylpyrimidine kinase [Armatimonadota bacterium]
MSVVRALTIAGSDSGGGAGIQADLKTFSALGVFGMTAVTAITAQNTRGVLAVQEVPADVVAAQIDAVATDIGIDAAKTGMLASAAIVEAVADRVRARRIDNLVVDPVMIAKSGAPLLRADAQEALVRLLLPLARIVTPNLHEAGALVGRRIEDLEEMREAARRIAEFGPRLVLLKGGHLSGDPTDVVYDGRTFTELHAPRIATHHTHGTGCVLSAAIAAYLAKGVPPIDAIAGAKRFVTRAIEAALPLGGGFGPCNPLFDAISPDDGFLQGGNEHAEPQSSHHR